MSGAPDRLTRVNELIKREMSDLINRFSIAPSPSVLVSVTEVRTSVDLRNATVSVNGETYLTWEMDDKIVAFIEGNKNELLVNSQGTAKVTIEPCDEIDKVEFKAPEDMQKVNMVSGIERYENDKKVTLYNKTAEFKKVKIGNTIVNVAPESIVTYEKKVWE